MDTRTLDFYEQNASQVCRDYRQARPMFMERIQELLPFPNSRILDVGSGSGRDLAFLLSLGYDAFGMEPSTAMRTEAIHAYPELADRLLPYGLPLVDCPDLPAPFQGILCNASFMHVPEEEVEDAAASLQTLLQPGGRLVLSVPSERADVGSLGRDSHGRLYRMPSPNAIGRFFMNLGFQELKVWEEPDFLGRTGIRWRAYLFELGEGSPVSSGP